MKRKISLFLIFILLFNLTLPLSVFAADLKWPTDYKLSGLEMPFFPYDKYETMQNPPDFSWSAVTTADSYDLIVCKDENLSEIVYEKKDIKRNFYNFESAFEIDTYYWSVRYKQGNKYSEWAPARRFRISPDASEFPVPSPEVLASRIPKEHPRLWMKDGLSAFRKHGETPEGRAYIERLQKYVEEHMNDEVPKEPQWEDFKDDTDKFYTLRGEIVAKVTLGISYGAFLYVMTGDETYGNFAKKYLMAYASWDPNGVTNYTSQDQVHREIAFYSAIGYDWLYPLLTEAERKQVIDMIRERTMVMANDLVYSDVDISVRPYESHGSSAYTLMLIISMVLLIINAVMFLSQSITNAEDVSRKAFENYANVLDIEYQVKEKEYEKALELLNQSYENIQQQLIAETR